jgi:hypothetical protein
MYSGHLYVGRSPGSTDCLVDPPQQQPDRDVLGSMERFPSGSVGTLRSIRSNGSIPTLERVRREISNHSIGSQSQTSSGQVRLLCLFRHITFFYYQNLT